MPLSNDLISQFVKSTRDDTKTKSETTVYGTIRSYDGTTAYVQLDNTDQDLLTPVKASSIYIDSEKLKENANGERVMVLIKNHTATITGNISSPSARQDNVKDVGDKVDGFSDIIVTNTAKIKTLEADNVTINNTLIANAAKIKTLETDKLDAKTAEITYATIESLKATDAKINNLDATYATIKSLEAVSAKIDNLDATYASIDSLDALRGYINNLGATYATIDSLKATDARIDNLGATYATITALNAAKGTISDLTADVADINTLMFGSATGNSIQTSFANAVIAQLGNAQIKSAMIDSVSASKITSGDIITNNINVKSQDGRLLISDETIQISDSARVRVQIGKDASNDYSINIWDESGNLMFSEGGITDKAIKEAIIRNDMVSDTANIAAHKLDIDSLFEEINGSTNTIKSTKVYLDDKNQTLDVAFTSLSTTVSELQNGVSSQGTQITAIQGQIASRIWQQDINTAKNELGEETKTLSDKYSTLEQRVDGLSSDIGSNTTAISKKADNTTVTNVTNRVSTLETSLSGFQSTVSETYATKTEVDSVNVGGRNLLLGANNAFENSNYGLTGYVYADPTQIVAGEEYTVSFEGMLSDPVQTGFYINTYPSPYPQCVVIPAIATDGEYHYYKATFKMPNNGSYTSLGIYSNTPGNQKLAGVRNIKLEKGNRATDWTLAPEDVDKKIAVAKQSGDNAQAAVDTLETEVTTAKTQISQNTEAINLRAIATDVENKFKNYSTTTEMESAIQLKADSITNAVSSTYATKESVDSISIGGRNLLKGSLGPFTASGGREFLNTGHDVYPIFEEYGLVQYTISMDMKSPDDVESGTIQVYLQNGSGSYHSFSKTFQVTNEWNRYSFTFIPTENVDFTDKRSLLAFYGTYGTGNFPSVKNIKLEKGNKATDWTPAPEDIDTEITNIDSRISSAESSITQISNKITANVTETTNLGTRMTTIEQTASRLTTRITNAESDIIDASKTATNYLGFSSGGLVIGDMTASTLGNNVLIDSDSVDIRNGNTTLASFGADYLYLAKNSRNATIDMCNGLATMYHASKYSYDSLFVIDTAVVEMIGASTPLCLTSTSSLENVSIQFANSSKVLGGIGIVGSWLRRYGSNMFDTYTILDKGNFHDVMDEGWVYCTYGDGFTRYSNNHANIQVRKVGKQVYLRGEAKPTTAVTPESETSTVLAVVPEGYRPSYRQQFVMQGSSAYRWLLSVHTNGNLCISRYTNDTTMNKSISAGAWLCCHAQWIID